MLKEAHWKLIAQCIIGTFSGVIGATLGFFIGVSISSAYGRIYETGEMYGAIVGMIIGATIGTLFFYRIKVESYKNISLTGMIISPIIVLMYGITYIISPIFIGLSFIQSLIITLCIHFYKKKHPAL